MVKKIIAVIFYSFFLVVAGENSGADFYVDMEPISVSVEDSYYDTQPNQQFQVAVYVTDVSNLNAYSVRLKIVTGKYSAISASENIPGTRENILKYSGDVEPLFIKDIQADKVEVAGSLGSSTATTNTSGLLGVFTFQANITYNESVTIEIYDAVLTSTGGDLDEFTSPSSSFYSGTYSVIPEYTVTFIEGSNGSITGTLVQKVLHGSDCSPVTAEPDVGYDFTNWTGDYSGTANPLTITNVTSDMTITANFTIKSYTVTFVEGANGSITGTLVQTVNHGSDCSPVTAVPNLDYHFVGWTGSYTGTDNPLTITNVTSDMTITANFVQSGSITVSGLGTEPDVYIHATNGWQGTKALDGDGTINDLKPGVYILSIHEIGKRIEVVSIPLTEGTDTTITISLRDAIPVIFTDKTALKDKYGGTINTSGTFNTSVMDDIDRDGDLDLVVVEVDGDISYYMNDGGFETPTTDNIALGASEDIVCVRCADLNGDGERELVIGLNTGEIFSFDMDDGTETSFYSAESGLTGFDITEFNGDDYPDLLLGYGDGTVDIVLSTGPGSWGSPVNVTADASPLSVDADATPLAMDVDGDGLKDLLVGNQEGYVQWFKGDGTAEFGERDSVNSGGVPFLTSGNTALSMGYDTTMNELPFIIATDAGGNVYQANAILLGDVDDDGQVYLTDFTIFVDTWRLDENDGAWDWDTNFDVTPNSSDYQEVFLSDFNLFTDSWRKEK